VVALETPWANRATPSASGPPASAKPTLASESTTRPARTPPLRPDPADQETARDAAQERTATVRAEQEPGLELRQVVPVGEVGEERE
jgi:hypothetical protein